MLLLSVTAALAAPLAECRRAYATPDVNDALDAAEHYFQAQDAANFREAEGRVLARLECVEDPLVPEVLARVYLLEALRAFLAKDSAAVASALAGMAASSPGYQIPLDLVPDGHPVRKAMARAGRLLRDPMVTPLAPMETGWIEADGEHRTDAPTNRDVVLQRFGPDGHVSETAYIHVGETLAAWTTVAVAPPSKWADQPEAPPGPVDPPPEKTFSAMHPDPDREPEPEAEEAPPIRVPATAGPLQGKPHVEGGFELGLPISLRLGYHTELKALRSFGARAFFGITWVVGKERTFSVVGGSGYFDFRVVENLDVELSAGVGYFGTFVGPCAGLAFQYDPYTWFQLNLGVMFAAKPNPDNLGNPFESFEEGVASAPDATGGFVW